MNSIADFTEKCMIIALILAPVTLSRSMVFNYWYDFWAHDFGFSAERPILRIAENGRLVPYECSMKTISNEYLQFLNDRFDLIYQRVEKYHKDNPEKSLKKLRLKLKRYLKAEVSDEYIVFFRDNKMSLAVFKVMDSAGHYVLSGNYSKVIGKLKDRRYMRKRKEHNDRTHKGTE